MASDGGFFKVRDGEKELASAIVKKPTSTSADYGAGQGLSASSSSHVFKVRELAPPESVTR